MPPYKSSVFQVNRKSLVPGQPAYSFGSLNTLVAPTKMLVSNVALTSNVVTLSVKVVEGPIPVVANVLAPQISVQGTTSTSGLFNVNNVALTTVAIDPITGIGTVTFPLTHADVVSVANTGIAIVPQPEVPDTLTSGKQSGESFAVPATYSSNDGTHIEWAYSFPTAPAAATLQLEGAMLDIDNEYSSIDKPGTTVLTAGGETRSITSPQRWNFLRITVLTISGSNFTGLGKISI